MSPIDLVLSHPVLSGAPPILVDVGASGGTHPAWQKIARHSIGVGSEPDSREIAALDTAQQKFRRWIFSNRLIVSGEGTPTANLYLTRSPYCSSTLQPDSAGLADWSFADLFEVVNSKSCPASTLTEVLRENQLTQLDWLKCDTQGTDLRIFQSLPTSVRTRVLVVEFEPGIIDAYQQEDKFSSILAAMEKEPYWLAKLEVQGVPRGNPEMLRRRLGNNWARQYARLGPIGPGWVNAIYLRRFSADDDLGLREYLLGWAFAALLGQPGFALEIAELGMRKFSDPIFGRLADAAVRQMKWSLVASWRQWPRFLWRKLTGQ